MRDITGLFDKDCGKDICNCFEKEGLIVGQKVKFEGRTYRVAPIGSIFGRLVPFSGE